MRRNCKTEKNCPTFFFNREEEGYVVLSGWGKKLPAKCVRVSVRVCAREKNKQG